jgi:hypothetical protein
MSQSKSPTKPRGEHTHTWQRRPDLDGGVEWLGYSCECGVHGGKRFGTADAVRVTRRAETVAERHLESVERMRARDRARETVDGDAARWVAP